MYDVLIVGCGVVGAATAYQLSRYNLSVCVCERYNDVAMAVQKPILQFCMQGLTARLAARRRD